MGETVPKPGAEPSASSVDDLAESLAHSFAVTKEINSTDAPHPRYHLFKAKTTTNQADRRRRFLEDLKRRREDYTQRARRLAQADSDDDKKENEEDAPRTQKRGRSESECEPEASNKLSCYDDADIKREPSPYKNQLMLSEWMEEVPDDLSANWVVKMIPAGKRTLVLSTRGRTSAFYRNGYRAASFYSALPGGRPMSDGSRGSDYCILDCVYDETQRCYYIIDLMCWRGQPLYDSDTEFRFFWLQSKVSDEIPALRVASDTNPYRFEVLPYHACDNASLEALMQTGFAYVRDGLLFFHKEARYEPGRNPACLWLKPSMTADMLGIPDTVGMGADVGRPTPSKVVTKVTARAAQTDAMAT